MTEPASMSDHTSDKAKGSIADKYVASATDGLANIVKGKKRICMHIAAGNKPVVQLDLFNSESNIASTRQWSDLPDDESPAHAALFTRLACSQFRSRFHLSQRDIAYARGKGADTIMRHATEIIARRLAPATIPNDGKQTPMRGHPVFVAQHATACCCRGCLSKWHHIPSGRELTTGEQQYIVSVLMAWIKREVSRHE